MIYDTGICYFSKRKYNYAINIKETVNSTHERSIEMKNKLTIQNRTTLIDQLIDADCNVQTIEKYLQLQEEGKT